MFKILILFSSLPKMEISSPKFCISVRIFSHRLKFVEARENCYSCRDVIGGLSLFMLVLTCI